MTATLRIFASSLLCTGLACAPSGATPDAAGTAGHVAPRAPDPLPAGRGTLHQDEFTVALRDEALLVKVTPLSESVIRLAAPDTYGRLHALAESRRVEAAAAAGHAEPSLYLVSFFSYAPDTRFEPEDLQLLHQGRLLRARAVLPLTPGWGSQLLQQQEVQTAVYAFETGIDPDLPLVVRYGLVESDQWTRILPRLRTERARVRARAGSS